MLLNQEMDAGCQKRLGYGEAVSGIYIQSFDGLFTGFPELVETLYSVVEQLLLVPLPLNPEHLTMFGYGKDHRSSYSQGPHAGWDMHTADCGRPFGLTPPIQPSPSQPRSFGGAVVPKMVT